LVFNLNGHIVSHLAIGHLTWASYFLLPFFITSILELSQNKNISWRWVSKICFIQFFVYLAGGYHIFVWCLLFIGFIFFTDNQNKKWIFLTILFSILINSYRILPSALLVKLLPIDFMAGFPTTDRLFTSLISVSTLADAYAVPNKVNVLVWEFDFYIGLIGFLLIVIFSGMSFLPNCKNSIRNLMLPIIAMIVLSIGNFYMPIFDTGIPLISGERISSRFFIIPLLFLLFISAINMQKLINDNKNKYSFALLILIILLANDLTQHMANWEVITMIRDFPSEISSGNLIIGTMHDPLYLGLFLSGSLITVLVLIFLGYKLFGSRNKNSTLN
jgi:hypothetical protein